MINKDYWDNFYSTNNVTNKETSFAIYTMDYIENNNIKGNMIDIACGNGRDSSFFQNNDINTTGLDLSIDIKDSNFKFIKGNLLDFDYSNYNIAYLRFVVHALKEDEFDSLLNKLSENKNIYIFIETRSSRDITNEDKSETYFKSSIGDKHFRLLYSKEYLDNKLSK